MKKISLGVLTAVMIFSAIICFASCGCNHEWRPADCMTPAICLKCGKTKGKPNAGKHGIVKISAVEKFPKY